MSSRGSAAVVEQDRPVAGAREVHPVVRAQAIAARVERLERQVEAARRERLEAVAQLVADGYTHLEVARLLGVSKPRAGQLVAQARDEGLIT